MWGIDFVTVRTDLLHKRVKLFKYFIVLTLVIGFSTSTLLGLKGNITKRGSEHVLVTMYLSQMTDKDFISAGTTLKTILKIDLGNKDLNAFMMQGYSEDLKSYMLNSKDLESNDSYANYLAYASELLEEDLKTINTMSLLGLILSVITVVAIISFVVLLVYLASAIAKFTQSKNFELKFGLVVLLVLTLDLQLALLLLVSVYGVTEYISKRYDYCEV